MALKRPYPHRRKSVLLKSVQCLLALRTFLRNGYIDRHEIWFEAVHCERPHMQ